MCKVAVLRTENPVLHPLPVLALEVAEAPAKEVVLVVKAVAATLDSLKMVIVILDVMKVQYA